MDQIFDAVLAGGERAWGLRYLVELVYPLDIVASTASVIDHLAAGDERVTARLAGSLEGVDPSCFFDGVVVEGMIDAGYAEGQADGDEVGRCLFSALTTGMRSGVVGEPFKEDIALKDAAVARLATASAGSDTNRFWHEILQTARQRIGEIE